MREPDPKRELVRHTLATLAYRGGKAVRGAPADFAEFRPCKTGRTSSQILAHLGDLIDWALSIAAGKQTWRDSKPQSWKEGVDRFFATLQRFDDYLASAEPLHVAPERLFQGPIADAFTHVGQIAMLRRIAESPIRGENYFAADIMAGRVGPDQAAPKREFE
jgi:hypothetical protein